MLWACFAALGEPPPAGVVVMAYLTGTLGNVVPLPGGLGGVEGAIIGAFLAFGVDPGARRGRRPWLPGVRVLVAIVPGVLAYVRLLRTVREWDEGEITQSM